MPLANNIGTADFKENEVYSFFFNNANLSPGGLNPLAGRSRPAGRMFDTPGLEPKVLFLDV